MAQPDFMRSAQLAGITRAADRHQLERLLTPEVLIVPPGLHFASLEPDAADGIAWREPTTEEILEGQLAKVSDEGILEAFLGLADADGEGPFLNFAQRYGPLRLCDLHGLPEYHPQVHVPEMLDDAICLCDDFVSVDAWRGYAQELAAAFNIAAALHRREPASGGRESWARVLGGRAFYHFGGRADVEAVQWIGSIENERFFLGLALDDYVSLAGLRPVVRWEGEEPRPEIYLGGGGVFAAAVRHLIFAVAKLEGLAICAGCGQAFTPTRRPARGRRAWCPGCGKTAASRQAMRDRRRRLAAESADPPA